jgi:hypothetical protein
MRRGRSAGRRALPSRPGSVFRVSHPLDGFLPPTPFRPCFVTVALMGFRPSELFSTREVVAPLGVRSPPVVILVLHLRPLASPIVSSFVRETPPRIADVRARRSAATTDFRVWLLAGVRHRRQRKNRPADALLSWASASPGLPAHRTWIFVSEDSPPVSFLASTLRAPRRSVPRLCAGSSESQSTRLPARWLSPPCLPS